MGRILRSAKLRIIKLDTSGILDWMDAGWANSQAGRILGKKFQTVA